MSSIQLSKKRKPIPVLTNGLDHGKFLYSIEKNVPLPVDKPKGRPPMYPWDDMKVGDSFAVPETRWGATRTSLANWKKRRNKPDFKVISRKEGAKRRVWRVK